MIPVLYRLPDWIPGVGGQPITSFGVLLLAAFLGAGFLFVRRLRGRDPLGPAGGAVGAPAGGWELVVAAAIGGMVGAKLLHLGVHWALDLPTGGLGRAGLHWFGGLVGGAAAAFWQADRVGIDRERVAGAAAPALALGYAIGRVGSFLVGAETACPRRSPGASPSRPEHRRPRPPTSSPASTSTPPRPPSPATSPASTPRSCTKRSSPWASSTCWSAAGPRSTPPGAGACWASSSSFMAAPARPWSCCGPSRTIWLAPSPRTCSWPSRPWPWASRCADGRELP